MAQKRTKSVVDTTSIVKIIYALRWPRELGYASCEKRWLPISDAFWSISYSGELSPLPVESPPTHDSNDWTPYNGTPTPKHIMGICARPIWNPKLFLLFRVYLLENLAGFSTNFFHWHSYQGHLFIPDRRVKGFFGGPCNKTHSHKRITDEAKSSIMLQGSFKK